MRGKPRPPQHRPFADYAKSKSWHLAKSNAIARVMNGSKDFSLLMKIHYSGYGLTPSEQMFFNIEPTRMDELFREFPFWSIVKKTTFNGQQFNNPVKIG